MKRILKTTHARSFNLGKHVITPIFKEYKLSKSEEKELEGKGPAKFIKIKSADETKTEQDALKEKEELKALKMIELSEAILTYENAELNGEESLDELENIMNGLLAANAPAIDSTEV